MANDGFTVQPAVVKNLGTTLQGSADSFLASAKRFDKAMNSLVSVAKGDAVTEFDALAGEWTRAQGQVNKALSDLGVNTESAGVQYEDGRDQQNQQVKSRGGQMNFHVEDL